MKKCIVAVLFIMIVSVGVFAEEYTEKSIISEQLEASGVYELDVSAAEEIAPDFHYGKSVEAAIGGETENPMTVFKNIIGMFIKEIKKNMADCMKIILIALCLGVVSSFAPENEKILNTSFYVSYMVILIMLISSFTTIIDIAKDGILSMDIFMRSAIPVLGGLSAISGGGAQSAMVGVNIMGLSAAVSVLGSVALPAATFSAMLGGVNNLSAEFNLSKVSSAIRRAVIWILGIVMTIFTAIISTKSFAAVSMDDVTKRTIKYAFGSFVPFVGGVMSETFESVVACGKLVKTASGVVGVVAVLYMALSPIIKILSVLAIYKITSLIITPMCDKRISNVIDEMASALTIVLALVIASGILFMVCAGIIAAI